MQARYRMWIGIIVLIIIFSFLVAFAPIRPVPKAVGFGVVSTTRYEFPQPVAEDKKGLDAKAAEIRPQLEKAGVELDFVNFIDATRLEVKTVALTQDVADEQAAKVLEALKTSFPGVVKAESEDVTEAKEKPLFSFGEVFAVYSPTPQIRLGLDLQGGAHVVLRCTPETKIPFFTPEHQPMAMSQSTMDTPAAERPKTTKDGKDIAYPNYTHEQLESLVRDYLVSQGIPVQGLKVAMAGDSRIVIETEARDEDESKAQQQTAQGFLERTFPGLELTAGELEAVYITPGTAEKVQNVIDRRLWAMSDIREPIVQTQGDDKIIVELPGVREPERVLKIVRSTAMLEFRLVPQRYTLPETAEDDYSEWQDTQGNTSVPWDQVLAESELAFTGRDLQDNAAVSPDNTTSNWVVHFELKNERKKDFLNFTRRNVGRLMAIVLDDECQMAPSIKSEIPGAGIIEGRFDAKEASDLKLLLNAGALPVPLEVDTNRTISPTLGSDTVAASLRAGLAGFVLVLVFMIAYYRVPGLLACGALILYVLLLLAVLTPYATMTLPGVAAFILSIGMAVDANVIIFERLKEELWSGKVIRTAIETGFDRAWTAILDANITTLIIAGVLFFLGSSLIKSFAVTLFAGVCCSMFTAVTVTRWLVTMVGSSRLGENRALFGDSTSEAK